MKSTQILSCKDKIKQILKNSFLDYPLYLSELIEIVHGEFSEDTIKQACDLLAKEDYIDPIIGLDENYHEYVYAIGGLL